MPKLLHQHSQETLCCSDCAPFCTNLWNNLKFHNSICCVMQGKHYKRKTKLTIIFSKRSMISFSERFIERSSKRGWGTGSSAWVEMGSVGCCIRGFSFFIPVFLKLVIRSRWKKKGCYYYCFHWKKSWYNNRLIKCHVTVHPVVVQFNGH